jgi:hypothetical protein
MLKWPTVIWWVLPHGSYLRPVVIISLFPVTIRMPRVCGGQLSIIGFIGHNTELLCSYFLHEYH